MARLKVSLTGLMKLFACTDLCRLLIASQLYAILTIAYSSKDPTFL